MLCPESESQIKRIESPVKPRIRNYTICRISNKENWKFQQKGLPQLLKCESQIKRIERYGAFFHRMGSSGLESQIKRIERIHQVTEGFVISVQESQIKRIERYSFSSWFFSSKSSESQIKRIESLRFARYFSTSSCRISNKGNWNNITILPVW